MNDKLVTAIKTIYSQYHAGEILPEEALDELEQAINETEEEE